MARIAFIGAGRMGRSMAGHLLKQGHTLTVYNRTRASADALVAAGATWADTAVEAVREAEFVITIVGGPPDVEQIYLGGAKAGGVIDAMAPQAVLIDMTTSSPRLAERFHAAAKARGLGALDAPVTGGPQGADGATLTIMVGGDDTDLERARPVLSAMGSTVLHYGKPGGGHRAKLVNQTVGMLNLLSALEGLFFARKAGLDTDQVLTMLQNGLTSSKSLFGLAPLALKGEFPPNFHPAHVLKDLTLAVEEADSLGLDLPVLKTARLRWKLLLERFPQARAVHEVARLYE